MRFEFKYVIPRDAKEFLLVEWSPFLMRAPYTDETASYPILSQYYDSPRLTFYYEKYAGIGLRHKVRLRTYGYSFRDAGATFLEIKRRTDETISKTRARLRPYRPHYLEPEHWPYPRHPSLACFCALRDYHGLRRSAQVFYVREAYQGVLDPEVRITFDSGLTAMYPGERFTSEMLYDRSRQMLSETQLVLEVKVNRSLPKWVQQGIKNLELEQRPVPKYVMAVDFLNLVKLQTEVYV